MFFLEIFWMFLECCCECFYYFVFGNYKFGNYGEVWRYNDFFIEKEFVNF